MFFLIQSRIAIFSSLLCLCFPSFAFINVESLRQSGRDEANGKTKLEFNGRNGNTDKVIIQGASTNRFMMDKNEVLFLLSYQYGETSKVKDTNNGSGHLRLTRPYRPWMASEAFLQSQFDEFQNLTRRNLMGLGMRWRLFEKPAHFLFLGTGAFHEEEDLKGLPGNSDMRGNMYLSYLQKINNSSELSSTLYYQPNFKTFLDFRLRFQVSLEVKMNSFLSIVTDLSVAHDSRPPEGVELTDTVYLVGFLVNY
ncbi:MAG: DUF481 domain-containing protein [Bdellovibrionales bacterium]|nr:DUF481 domain-containing protein [Bdellovibrionales bacterium]